MNHPAMRFWCRLISLVLVLGVLLVACGGTPAAPERESAPTEQSGASEQQEESSEPAPAAGEGALTSNGLNPEVSGNVEFWHFWGSPVRRNAIRRVVALCQQQLPNITVEEVFKPWGDIWTANIAAVAAGSGMPDVIVEDRPQLPQRAADGIATNLQPFVERDGFDSSRYWPFTWEETLYEGDPYGIPFETDVRVLFWNKNAFREAGLDPEKPPRNWEELESYADKLDKKREDGSYERIGFFPLWRIGADFWAWGNGHPWIVDDRPVVDDPAVVETLEWVQTWVERYGGWSEVQSFQGQFGAPPNDLFMSGATPMLIDIAGYSSVLNFYRPRVPTADGGMENLEWGISHVPFKEEQATWSGGFALSIPEGADNAEAAWEFIKCATGHEAQVSWARDTAAIPTHAEAATDPLLMADPNWQTIIEQMEWSRGTDYVPAYPNWTEQLTTRYEQLWSGEMTAEQFVQEAQQEIDQTIEQNQ